jgi:tRNA(Ile)-lysidine synthase
MRELDFSIGGRPTRDEWIGAGDTVVVAVSGGVDSLVLLHRLRFAAPDLQLRLHAAHFDHRMREESATDVEWLKGVCRSWELPLHIGSAEQVPRTEAEARAARYGFLEQVAAKLGADWIATAHHADDQVETVLFRLLRGTGLDGLAGIPARRGRIIRPLLQVRRSEIEQYAARHRLQHREDRTNSLRRFARNRIRLDLLPALEADWVGIRPALLRLAAASARAHRRWQERLVEIEERVITSEDASVITLARPILLGYHPEIRGRFVRRCLERLGAVPGRAGTGALQAFINLGASGTSLDLKGGLRAEREFDTIRLMRALDSANRVNQPLSIEAPKAGSGQAVIGGQRYTVQWSLDTGNFSDDSVVLDPADLRFPLMVRPWQPGDRIRLPVGTKKLKKLFAEKRFGRTRRHSVPVLVDRNRDVLWVVGLARAADQVGLGSGLRITVTDGQLD